ncbi:glutamyl-tRNA(Gln) and/or aspartyl-tRNA(Asn) amidotransferase [Neisseria bacilliformis ATCC BAA-1200]|uniref:Glutamyl-tRNA(Gln) and/or aspartyl-tRNA(Asn) amidotransferase n=1 Tax=Neisseria bacilliformis ATCC BAA-1200 TaxID=888742 RepID=F2BCP5_9NEIS|nr:glutamyl-tRNA(Gln) and/or aspartyl-tRNA(Asn) amidotransferase [Neisseria bacilliformis ATCC BAA-1200]
MLFGGASGRVRGLRHTPYLNGGGRLKTQFRHSQKRFQTASGRIDQ